MQSLLRGLTRLIEPRTRAYELLVVFIGPALLFVFPALPFANLGNCDPWYVYGLYFNLPEFLRWTPHMRQTGRLTATLPGYFLTYFVPGISTDYVLFLLFFGLAVLFLYKTAALFLSRERAALVAIFFGLSPLVVGNYAVTYTVHSLTYEILALYCASRAVVSSRLRHLIGWMLLSGVACGSSLHAHLAVLPFIGFVYVFFALCIALEFERSIPARAERLAAGFGALLCGVIAITLTVALFVVAEWGGRFWAILNQFDYLSQALERDADIFWIKDWYQNSSSVGMYILGFAAAAIGIFDRGVRLIRHNASVTDRRILAIAAAFIAMLTVLIYDVFSRGVTLQYEYYYVFLWPFLALVVFAADIDRGLVRKPVFILIFSVACLVGIAIKQYELPPSIRDHEPAASVAVAVVAAALLIALLQKPRTLLLTGYLLVLASATLVVRPHQMGGQLWERPNSNEQRNSYARLKDGLKFLAQLFSDPNLSNDIPLVWVDPNGPVEGPAYSVAYYECHFHPFPKIDPALWATPGLDFEPGVALVVVSRPPHLFDRVKAALKELNLVPTEIASKTISDERGPYEIMVVSVSGTQPP
jgi:hypothetical protein